jgi:molybdopterin-guanine dinucleotide biosynthesis protein
MLVVVGGHSRNIGKTSMVEGLIRQFRDRQWTAVKITQYGHRACTNHDEMCGCEAAPGEAFALSEEYEPGTTDSARFLAAGASRSFWLRTPAGELLRASAAIQKLLAQSENVIVESNSVIELVRPDLFLMLMDPGCKDFKASSLRFMDRVDAFVIVDRGASVPSRCDWDQRPRFVVTPPRYVSREITDLVSGRFPTPAP